MKDHEVFCQTCGNPIRFVLPENVDIVKHVPVVTCPKCGTEYAISWNLAGAPIQAVFRPKIRS